MVNSRASQSRVQIGNYKSPGTAASKVFTFAAIDFDLYSHIELQIDIGTTAALILELKYNSVTATYYADGRTIISGTETLIDNDSLAHWILLPVSMTQTAAASSIITVKLGLPETATMNSLQGSIHASQRDGGGDYSASFVNTAVLANKALTSLTIETDTSTWLANTRMTVWKIKR